MSDLWVTSTSKARFKAPISTLDLTASGHSPEKIAVTRPHSFSTLFFRKTDGRPIARCISRTRSKGKTGID